MNFNESNARSFSCNGQLIKNIRETLGLTQKDLAKRAGYSVRLIGKAESGVPVSRVTIEVLAEALSTDEKKWRPDDLVFNPTNVVKGCLQAKASGEESLILNLRTQISPNSETRIQSKLKLLNCANQYTGIDGLLEYHRVFSSKCKLTVDSDNQKISIFHARNDFVAWDERPWTVLQSGKQVFVTTRFVFVNDLLVYVEDRIQNADPVNPNSINGERLDDQAL